MGSMFESPAAAIDSPAVPPFRVLVVGGSYGGLSAALNLQDLCRGRPARCGPKPSDGEPQPEGPQFPVEITIIDERDGFCAFLLLLLLLLLSCTPSQPPLPLSTS